MNEDEEMQRLWQSTQSMETRLPLAEMRRRGPAGVRDPYLAVRVVLWTGRLTAAGVALVAAANLWVFRHEPGHLAIQTVLLAAAIGAWRRGSRLLLDLRMLERADGRVHEHLERLRGLFLDRLPLWNCTVAVLLAGLAFVLNALVDGIGDGFHINRPGLFLALHGGVALYAWLASWVGLFSLRRDIDQRLAALAEGGEQTFVRSSGVTPVVRLALLVFVTALLAGIVWETWRQIG